MSDTIYRQAAIDAARQYCIDNLIEDADYHSNGIEYELSNLPSAQPEIIRCKDCKAFYDGKWCVRYLKAFNAEDFCSYAERRKE